MSSWRDWVGIVASVGCAIHCAVMPFVFAYLPAWGLSFLADEAFHKWMALICFLIAIAAFIPGLRRHRNWLPVSVGATGLALITFAAFGLGGECCPGCDAVATRANLESGKTGPEGCQTCDACASDNCKESDNPPAVSADRAVDSQQGVLAVIAPWITPVGGMILVGAHLLNRKYGCLCGCCGRG